jgi:hypothetical protein
MKGLFKPSQHLYTGYPRNIPMTDIRKIIVVFVIGVLYAVFVTSVSDAVYPSPDYADYCEEMMMPMPVVQPKECPVIPQPECEKGASMAYEYDSSGCPSKAICDYCYPNFEKAQEKYNFVIFIISSILGLAAIAIGLFLPIKGNNLNEWVATGFMLGGLISLFIGTIRYYADMARIARPIVLLVELVLIIYLAYKKLKK